MRAHRRPGPSFLALLPSLLPALPAQTAAGAELHTVANGNLRYAVQLPPGWKAGQWTPLLVVFPGIDDAAAQPPLEPEIAAAGFVVVAPLRSPQPQDLAPLFADLRRRFRIDQGGMHALLGLDADGHALAAVLANLHQFQTVSFTGPRDGGEERIVQGLPARRLRNVPGDAAARARHFAALHAERALDGAAGEVARALDDFHDAAANADAARYFAILPDDALFLGTDGTERWTGAAFRRDMQRWFERDSAWTYVAVRRAVDVDAGGQFAWFDETLDNDGYGECRGSGVLQRRDGRWVLRQYHLSVPVPNDLTREVASRIAAFQRHAGDGGTTVVLVRHAEKQDASDDASLSDAGRVRAAALARALADQRLGAVFTSQYRRTAETVAPVCAAQQLEPVVVPAADARGLAARIRRDAAGSTVLVCGHSNTLPAILRALGIAEPPPIGDDDYDRLFVVTLGLGGPRLLALRY